MLAGLVLTIGGLVACGGDEDSTAGGLPREASIDDFCGNFEQFAQELGELGSSADASQAVTVMQDMSEAMRETGVPESATDEQAEGLEVTLDAIDELDADAAMDDLANLEDSFSESEQEKADAFDDYLDEECGEIE